MPPDQFGVFDQMVLLDAKDVVHRITMIAINSDADLDVGSVLINCSTVSDEILSCSNGWHVLYVVNEKYMYSDFHWDKQIQGTEFEYAMKQTLTQALDSLLGETYQVVRNTSNN